MQNESTQSRVRYAIKSGPLYWVGDRTDHLFSWHPNHLLARLFPSRELAHAFIDAAIKTGSPASFRNAIDIEVAPIISDTKNPSTPSPENAFFDRGQTKFSFWWTAFTYLSIGFLFAMAISGAVFLGIYILGRIK